jgi:N-methylhydantoinase B
MKAEIDLITLEVVLEYFISTVREMGKTMIRTAHSSIIYEGHDFSCALLNADGELVAQSEGSPAHIIPLPWQVREALTYFNNELYPGDVVLVNDCFSSGTHMNDVAMIVPFFANGRRVAIIVARAHWGDVGGMTPGSISGRATEFFQEGLRIPFLKVFEKGKKAPGILELILSNVRVPEEREGDFYAMLACCHTAQQRLDGLVERFGVDLVEQIMVEHLARAERRMRQALSEIEPGSYAYEDYFDSDNQGGPPVPLRVKLDIAPGSIAADFAGSSRQVRGPINCSLAVTMMGAFVALKALLDPHGPINQGAFRPISVTAPKGTIVNADYPAATGGVSEVRRRVESVVMGALAMAAPQYIAGDIKGTANHSYISCAHPDHGRTTIFYEYPSGGTGGFLEHDGSDTIRAYDEGDFTSIQPVEAVEMEHGLRIERCELRADSCGDGKSRGGLGLRREIRILGEEGAFSELSDRNIVPPFGVCGGHAAAPNNFYVVRDGANIAPSDIPGKVSAFPLRKGDVVVFETAGGGGYGKAPERDSGKVLHDVLEGYVSPERARVRYGIVICDGKIDMGATQRERERIRNQEVRLRIEATEVDAYIDGRRVCHLSPSDMSRLGIPEDTLVELVNPRGAPLRAWAHSKGSLAKGSTLLGPIGRTALAQTPGDLVELRIL